MENLGSSEIEMQHLIIRYLDGSASDEESVVLQQWLEESDEHFNLFRELRQDWLSIGCQERYRTDRGWEKTEQRLLRRMTGKRRRLAYRLVGYAAAVVLLFSVGYYSVRDIRQEKTALVVSGNIEPGSKKAVLVLSTDEKVELNNDSAEALLQGEAIVKKEGNTLVYDEKQPTGGEVEYNRLITPRGGEYSVILSDGTKVWLNAESELKYPVRFSGTERKVYLKGEAYFAVAKQAGKTFVVCSDDTKIRVLGTEFNVRNYDDQQMATTLVKGTVMVAGGNGQECRLEPGQQAVVSKGGIDVKEVEVMYYTAWKDGYFMYEEKSLDEIMRELSRWYDFSYFYQNSRLENEKLTAKLRKFDSVDKIFEILSETGHFGFVTKGKTVTVVAK